MFTNFLQLYFTYSFVNLTISFEFYSRLGTHRRQVRVLQDLVNKSDRSVLKEENDSEPPSKRIRPSRSPEKKTEIKKTPLKSALRTPSKGILLPTNSSTPLLSVEQQSRTSAVENSSNNDAKVETPIPRTPLTPKREVRFAEPLAVVDRFVAPRSSPRGPTEINVKKICFRVLNELGRGGSCVVYLVIFSINFIFTCLAPFFPIFYKNYQHLEIFYQGLN